VPARLTRDPQRRAAQEIALARPRALRGRGRGGGQNKQASNRGGSSLLQYLNRGVGVETETLSRMSSITRRWHAASACAPNHVCLLGHLQRAQAQPPAASRKHDPSAQKRPMSPTNAPATPSRYLTTVLVGYSISG